MLNTTEKKKKRWKKWELTNKALSYSYRVIWSIYFCSPTALISLPLPPVFRRETFLHFRDKNHSLLIHSSSFVSISHNKEITPTCDKSTHVHQTSAQILRQQNTKGWLFLHRVEHGASMVLREAKRRAAERCGVQWDGPVVQFIHLGL